jgi:hypothetical protein
MKLNAMKRTLALLFLTLPLQAHGSVGQVLIIMLPMVVLASVLSILAKMMILKASGINSSQNRTVMLGVGEIGLAYITFLLTLIVPLFTGWDPGAVLGNGLWFSLFMLGDYFMHYRVLSAVNAPKVIGKKGIILLALALTFPTALAIFSVLATLLFSR